MEDLIRSDDGEAVISEGNYKKSVTRKRFNVLQRGCRGKKALIEYASLPEDIRNRFVTKYGDPETIMKQEELSLPYDQDAQAFFNEYILPNGSHLPEKKQQEYTINARVLNALLEIQNTQKAMRRACNNNTPVIWSNVATICEELREAYRHTLPNNVARLRDKLRTYSKEGYACLISGKFCNDNNLKITKEAGRLIIALRRSRTPVYTTKQLFEEYNRRAEAKGLKPLNSISSLIQYLERPEVKPQWYDAVYGELAANRLFDRRQKTVMPSMRDSLWYGDGTKLNLFYKAVENGKLVVKTAFVYEVMDAYSETFLGFCICDNENFEAQFNAFRMAIEYSRHKPYEIVTDNQGGQRSKIAQQFFASISRVTRPTAPYNASGKSIESAFGRFQHEVLMRDWRFTGGNISAKEAWKINRDFIKANKDSLYTYDELVAAYVEARKVWNALPHYKEAQAHADMYSASINPKAVPVSDLDMMELFWIYSDKPSKFTSDGITIQYQKRKYTYEVLTEDGMPDMEWRSRNTGREFYCRFDPQSMDRVLLYTKNAMGMRFETVAYPYITIHRNIQEQEEGDMAFIRHADQANKQERVRRHLENYALEMEHGVAPEQNGLHTPSLMTVSSGEYERLADTIVIQPTPSEPIEIGEYTKQLSNLDYDPLSALNRL